MKNNILRGGTLGGLVLMMLWGLFGCSSGEKYDTSTAEGAFQRAEHFEKSRRFDEAIMYFNQVKNQHPYSRLATEAELRVADIYFNRQSYVEAQSAYQVFKELHPRHPRIDYVTYRLGMSFFNQLPSTIDRDLSLAHRALIYFEEVLHSYPTSEYAPKAAESRQEALRMLAEKELYIANFYFVRKRYDSALRRFEGLIQSYPGIGLDEKALLGATLSAHKTQELDKAKKYYSQLVGSFPSSDEAKRAESEIGNELQ